MKNRKNNLDERQEQTLLKIEHNGFWIAFWGLAAAVIIQTVALRSEPDSIIGELIVLFVISVYISAACLKNGIWDRRLKANPKTNLIVSVIAGVVAGAVMFFKVYLNYPDKLYGSIAAGVFTLIAMFALCFAALSISAAAYKKHVKRLEEEEK